MTYEKVKNLNPEEFKRFCGVSSHAKLITQIKN